LLSGVRQRVEIINLVEANQQSAVFDAEAVFIVVLIEIKK